MTLAELNKGQSIIVQMIWGERNIEFSADVIETVDKGVYVTPFMHQGAPLDLTIDSHSKVVCNIFADSTDTGKRVSWRNVELSTLDRNGRKIYQITTSGYNHMANYDDRRKHDRIVIHKDGKVYDPGTKERVQIKIYDISDIGISFFAAPAFQPSANQIMITFTDIVNDKSFNMKVECVVVRTRESNGLRFYGCRVVGENKDYLLYSFLQRIISKKQIKEDDEEE